MRNGAWSLLPEGRFIKQPKDGVPNAVKSETTGEYATMIRGPLGKPVAEGEVINDMANDPDAAAVKTRAGSAVTPPYTPARAQSRDFQHDHEIRVFLPH